eukprot:8997901-Alexandrium_andersonii.AAC.1
MSAHPRCVLAACTCVAAWTHRPAGAAQVYRATPCHRRGCPQSCLQMYCQRAWSLLRAPVGESCTQPPDLVT